MCFGGFVLSGKKILHLVANVALLQQHRGEGLLMYEEQASVIPKFIKKKKL